MLDIEVGATVKSRDETGVVIKKVWKRHIGSYLTIKWEDGSVGVYGPRLACLLVKEYRNNAVSADNNV